VDRQTEPLFRNPRFLKLWIGQSFSFVGDAVSMVALVILVAEITGSAANVGGVLIARFLPTLLGPAVGVIADRMDRRVILVSADLVRAAIMVSLVFTRELLLIYVLVFVAGLARTFFNPTVRAAFPGVVGGGDLTRANSVISGTFSIAIMVGPALGGFLVATVGVNAAFLLDAGAYVISAAFISRIPMPRPEREEESGFGEEFRAGFSYLKGARIPLAVVLGASLFMLTINITAPAEVFLARDVFGAGETGYGILVSVWGAGMIAGTALMAVLGDRVNLLRFFFVALFLSALAMGATGLAPTFFLALCALAVAGVANGIDNITTDTILQKRVPDAFLGRVFAVRFLGLGAAESAAYFFGGLAVDFLGTRETYYISGVTTALAGVLVLLIVLSAPGRKKNTGTRERILTR
jgi:MFS family permease